MNKQSGARRAYKLLTGSEPMLETEQEINGVDIFWSAFIVLVIFLITMIATCSPAHACYGKRGVSSQGYKNCQEHNKITVMFRPNCFPIIGHTCSELADAIYLAEGGDETNHPYGIMKKYKHTDARTACLNTIKHQLTKWLQTDQKEDFIVYLGNKYSPVQDGNPDWVRLVYWFLNNKEE